VLEVVPGDPAQFMLGLNATPEAVAALRTALGLDGPLLERYFTWVLGLLHGDFGISYTYKVPVAKLIGDRIWISLPLALFALALSTLIAFPVGILAAVKRNSPTDVGIMGATQVGLAVPNFWFAMLLVLLFSITLRWFSAGGFPGWEDPVLALKALTLPAVALALPQASILARVMRSSLLDTLGEDYIRSARAKGLSQGQTLWRHALRNALMPIITLTTLLFGELLAGAVLTEQVFTIPGFGKLIVDAVFNRDYGVVQGVVLCTAIGFILMNLIADILYVLVNPRLRAG